jgi:putative ABC transport system substrate-binding protein
MRRRDFMMLAAGAAAAFGPLAARAQQGAVPVIGFLNSESPALMSSRLAAFRAGLGAAGYSEGSNVAIEYRWADGNYERLSGFADELVRRKVSVIAANAPAVDRAKAATTTIPIVFFTGLDPVTVGLVASLNRPGGNLTGVSLLNTELVPKRVELLREMAPAATSIALLVNPANPNSDTVKNDSERAARMVGLQLHVVTASSARDIDAAFAAVARLKASALVIGPDPLFTSHGSRIAELALRHAMPTIYQTRQFVASGGLMSYSGSIIEAYRQIGVYAGRILTGEKPADLPVEQMTKVELIINLKTAKALGITVPTAILLRADEVIE